MANFHLRIQIYNDQQTNTPNTTNLRKLVSNYIATPHCRPPKSCPITNPLITSSSDQRRSYTACWWYIYIDRHLQMFTVISLVHVPLITTTFSDQQSQNQRIGRVTTSYLHTSKTIDLNSVISGSISTFTTNYFILIIHDTHSEKVTVNTREDVTDITFLTMPGKHNNYVFQANVWYIYIAFCLYFFAAISIIPNVAWQRKG